LTCDHDRAQNAVRRAVFVANPRSVVAHADMRPTAEAIDAFFALLASLAEFHTITADLERRQATRIPTPL
jgi:hypothetical protein